MSIARETIDVPGRGRIHSPVPEGIRVGGLIISSLLGPTTRVEGREDVKRSAEEDADLLFERMRDLVEAGRGSMKDVVDVSVIVRDDGDRAAINKGWVKIFPDADDRPARHILNAGPHGTHWRFAAHFMAVVDEAEGESHRLVYSPLITGRSPSTGELPKDPQEQADSLFEQLETFAKGCGGTLKNVISVKIYYMGEEGSSAVNKAWQRTFSDRSTLPARQRLVLPRANGEELFSAVATVMLED